ncbi:Putative electron transport protein yccM [Pragia fontium]|uniref:4Fe-4S binding protein n=1 Tax=Pragia fontium TaxID=82985 RepID=UPI000E06CB36|nr:4Fe-4S binding protein [Pragia fontium]SUB81343.1 Putative electron transport protein yccM [Pragia fontium]
MNTQNDQHSILQPVIDDDIAQAANRSRKKLVRRPGTIGGKLPWYDLRNAKLWRHATQSVFLLINIYICMTFYYWVRFYETGGNSTFVERPAGIEGWLPIAGLMNLKYTLETWQIPPIHAASMLLLIAFLAMSFLLKKAFCSWLCPIGTLSEALATLGKKLFGRHFLLPRWLDIPLRGLKYLLLAFFLYLVIPMPVQALQAFLMSPYGLIADVKMLNFFRFIGETTLISIIVLTIGSLFIQNLWCRYLCPYGALIGIFSLFSPFKIRRNADSCIDCGKCAKACPSRIPVDRLIQVRTVECTACMSCVESCPAKDTLVFSLTKPKGEPGATHSLGLSGMAVALMLTLILAGTIGYAKFAGHWDTQLPEQFYYRLIPASQQLGHP